MRIEKKKGISLVVIVITIIVVGFLAGVVIMSVSNDNQIGNARKSTFQSDLKVIQDAVDMYVSSKSFENLGEYSRSKFTKEDLESLEIIQDNPKYRNKFDVVDGQLMVNSNFTEDEKKWAAELGIGVNNSAGE